MKSWGSSTSASSDHDNPSTSAGQSPSTSAEQTTPQPVRAAHQAAETNGQAAQVSTVQVSVGNAGSPDDESASDTETDDSEEETSSESTASVDDDHAAEEAVTSQSQRILSSPAVICVDVVEYFVLVLM